MINAWLRLFRVVNLPTVPGDIWVGAVAVWSGMGIITDYGTPLVNATIAGTLLYMFGLADNDIVGARTDMERPIPEGRISLTAARVARGICLALAVAVGLTKDPISLRSLPNVWWLAAAALLVAVVVYNRTKAWWLMGLCRGLNVACGVAAAYDVQPPAIRSDVHWWPAAVVMAVWTVYIAAVTKYSEGEETDDAKKRRVGFLVGAIVYLQIIAMLLFQSGIVVLLAVLLVVMRMMKRNLRGVSAS